MSPLHGENVNLAEAMTADSATPLNIIQKVEEKETPVCSSQIQEKTSEITKFNASHYYFWKVLGEGSFSTVFLATSVKNGDTYAIKVCEKRLIVKERKGEYVKRERDVLTLIQSSPCDSRRYFVRLFHSFQDLERLYFVLTYAENGDLLPYVSNGNKFDEKSTQFYAAEILCALEHLHRLGIIHRDLKPENILFNENMHILITDFGSAKVLEDHSLECAGSSLSKHRSRSGSFVGTAQYVSPELLNDQSVSLASDIWALGCIIYQMIEGFPPFCGRCDVEIFQKIRKLELNFKETFAPVAKDLILKLLVLDSSSRLGALDVGQYISIRSHRFFKGVNFEHLHEVTSPIQPFRRVRESPTLDPKSVYPGLNNKQLSQLLSLALHDDVSIVTSQSCGKSSIVSILNSPEEMRERLYMQTQNNEWHMLVEGNLILRHGLVVKKKGLLTKKRVLLLTTGPHLYYADPVNRALKGEVPWSSELYAEAKNFKTFFVHTPERTFRWDDPEGNALIWCEAIKQVRMHLNGKNM